MSAIIYHYGAHETIEKIVGHMRNKPEVYSARHGYWRPYKPDSIDILIRWATVIKSPNTDIVYNLAEAIELASNKAMCRKVLFEAGIPVPIPTEELPCVGRTEKHRRGEGFWFCRTKEEVEWAKEQGAFYFSTYYPKTSEYRVHVAHGKILLVSKKIGDPKCLIWNREINGFDFKTIRWKQWRTDVISVAIRAVEIIGLDYGAVDIMTNSELSQPVVVSEINTSPKLGDYASSRYAEYFDWLIESGYRQDHLTYDKYAFKGGRD